MYQKVCVPSVLAGRLHLKVTLDRTKLKFVILFLLHGFVQLAFNSFSLILGKTSEPPKASFESVSYARYIQKQQCFDFSENELC